MYGGKGERRDILTVVVMAVRKRAGKVEGEGGEREWGTNQLTLLLHDHLTTIKCIDRQPGNTEERER